MRWKATLHARLSAVWFWIDCSWKLRRLERALESREAAVVAKRAPAAKATEELLFSIFLTRHLLWSAIAPVWLLNERPPTTLWSDCLSMVGDPALFGIRSYKRGPKLSSVTPVEFPRVQFLIRLSVLVGLSRHVDEFGLQDEVMEGAADWIRWAGTKAVEDLLEVGPSFRAVLDGDPSGLFAASSPATRAAYLDGLGSLSIDTGRRPEEIATLAVDLARRPAVGGPAANAGAGWFLLRQEGRDRLFAELGLESRLHSSHGAMTHTIASHWLGVAMLVGLIGTAGAWRVTGGNVWLVVAAAFASFEVALGIQINFAQRFRRIRPIASFIPSPDRPAPGEVVICIPSMLSSRPQIDRLLDVAIQNLKSSQAPETVPMVLLMDYPDSQHRMPSFDEDALVSYFREKVRVANETNFGERKAIRCVIRPRVPSPEQGCWMGWERKRGKILELLQLLDGRSSALIGLEDADIPKHRFLLVLDDDNVLTPGSLQTLLCAARHPLNHMSGNEGHALFVPSMIQRSLRPPRFVSPQRSAFYDATGVGVFPGKGLLDVAWCANAFSKIPENLILSHDAVEGLLARPALVSMASVHEGMPGTYHGVRERQHRWIRGDLQNLFFLVQKSLRRQAAVFEWLVLVLPILQALRPIILFTLLAYLSLTGFVPGSWLVLALFLAMPALELVGSVVSLSIAWLQGFWGIHELETLRISTMRLLIRAATVPSLALVALDAAARATTRFIRRSHTLEWRPSAVAESGASVRTLSLEAASAAVSLALLAAQLVNNNTSMPWLGLLLLWTMFPFFARYIRRT